ncbi:MAG: FHA domain-containing protein [Planctomycetes bacterium]|jgi:pSer/pThr/pTyr-binding forkhead associated (FHA) protein|nr:FHA domain-containing protein [Planctomycetota bacterium]
MDSVDHEGRDGVDPIFLEMDHLIRLSRLREIEFIMSAGQVQRVREIMAAVKQLEPGEYLLGTGPSTVGIIPLNGREVVLGRSPTVLEGPGAQRADYCAADTMYFVPREVSRTHARIVRQTDSPNVRHILTDLNSTCGTFVNGEAVDADGPGVPLEHGDIISLGPSQTSTYVYYRTPRAPLHAGAPREVTAAWVSAP